MLATKIGAMAATIAETAPYEIPFTARIIPDVSPERNIIKVIN